MKVAPVAGRGRLEKHWDSQSEQVHRRGTLYFVDCVRKVQIQHDDEGAQIVEKDCSSSLNEQMGLARYSDLQDSVTMV